jgi:hypothetical protein
MKKYFLALIAGLLFSTAVMGQTWSVKNLNYNAVAGVSFSGTGLDSLALLSGIRSTSIDWSIMGTGANTIWFATSLKGNGTSDTVLVWLHGYDELSGGWVAIDSLTNAMVSTTAGTTVTTGSLTLSSYFPILAIWVKTKSANTGPSNGQALRVSLFTVPPTLPDRSYWK